MLSLLRRSLPPALALLPGLACSRAGDGPFPVSLEISFPPASSLTEKGTVVVRGTAQGVSGVAAVFAGGVKAWSTDGFVTWQAVVPLAPGSNEIRAHAVDTQGIPSKERSIDVRFQILLRDLASLAVDDDHVFVLSSSRGLLAIDRASGERQLMKDPLPSAATAFVEPLVVALDGDRLLVADARPGGSVLLSVRLDNGLRTVLSGAGVGAGPAVGTPSGLAVAGDVAYLVDADAPALLAIDLASGDRSVVSDGASAGPALTLPVDLVLDGARAIVIEAGAGADTPLVAIDLATGDRSPFVAGADVGALSGLAVDGLRLLALQAAAPGGGGGGGKLLSVELATGAVTELGDLTDGPAEGSTPVGLGLMEGTAWFLDVTAARSQVLAVDLDTVGVTLFAGDVQGAGPALRMPAAMDVDGDRILVADAWDGKLGALDPASGDRTLLSGDGLGIGPALEPTGIAAGEGVAYVSSPGGMSGEGRVIAVDLATGGRTELSGPAVGLGPALSMPRGLDLDGGRLLVADPAMPNRAVLAVDLATGDRTVFADKMSTGIADFVPQDVAVGGTDAYVTKQFDAIVGVDLATTSAEEVSGGGVGTGPALADLDQILLDGGRALVPAGSLLIAVDLATGDRTVVADLGAVTVTAIALWGEWLVVGDAGTGLIHALDPVTGERVILSIAG